MLFSNRPYGIGILSLLIQTQLLFAQSLNPCIPSTSLYREQNPLRSSSIARKSNQSEMPIENRFVINRPVQRVKEFYLETPLNQFGQTPIFILKETTDRQDQPVNLNARYSYDLLFSDQCTLIIAFIVETIDEKNGRFVFRYLEPSPVSGYQEISARPDPTDPRGNRTLVIVKSVIVPKRIIVAALYRRVHERVVNAIHIGVKRKLESEKTTP